MGDFCQQTAHPVLCRVPGLVAGVGLEGKEVQDGIAAHQMLQLCGAEQVHGRPATQHHEAPSKRLKLYAPVQGQVGQRRQRGLAVWPEGLPGGG